MPSTYSSLLRLELMQTGEKSATWGDITNTNLGTLLEKGIAGTATVDVTAGDVTLTALNGADDQARCLILNITGSPGAARTVVAPSSSKAYIITNATSVAVTLKGAATVGVAVPSGERTFVAWNGSDFVRIGPSTDSPTFTGTTTVDSFNALGATTIGNAPGDSLTITPSAVSWPGNPTHSGNHTFSGTVNVQGAGGLTVLGNTVFGDAAGDSTTFNSGSVTWANNPTHSGNHTFSGTVTLNGALTANGNTTLGNAVGDTLNVAGGSLQVSASGTVGVGVAPSTGALLEVNGDVQIRGTNRQQFTNTLNSAYAYAPASNAYAIGTNSTDRVRVDSSGNVIVAASSNAGLGSGTDKFSVAGTIGLSGAQINVNPATDFEMVHRGAAGWWFYTDSATKVPLKIDRLAPTDSLQLTSSGVKIGGDGRLYGLSLHNNVGAVTGTTNQYVASGTYTPTMTNFANCSSATASGVWKWMRVGNVVTFSGNFSVTITTSSLVTQVGVSLPIPSNLTGANDLTGAVSNLNAGTTLASAAFCNGDGTNDRANVQFSAGASGGGANLIFYVVAQYEVL